MRTRFLTIICLALIPFCLVQAKDDEEKSDKKSGTKIFTGITGGLSIHGGYLFSDSPEKIFSSSGLGSASYVTSLKKDGFAYGFGAQLRIHLINHIHVGAEAYTSNMPFKNGSNVNTMWAGGMVDFFGGWGNAKPLIGLGIGGGKMKRLYVPEGDVQEEAIDPTSTETTSYNSSYTTTPFFYLDPYIGIEFPIIGNVLGMQFRIDYMLPFGNPTSKLTDATVKWSNFLTPSGPRLHVVLLFGQLARK